MADITGITWCDSTFNPWMGCTKVSPACDHCYAERDTRRFGRVEWGAGKPRVRTSAANWKLPERWNRTFFGVCEHCGYRGEGEDGLAICPMMLCISRKPKLTRARRRVFCASLADWLDNEVPIEWLVDLLDLIRRTPNLDWLQLTKRIGAWRSSISHARSYLAARQSNVPAINSRDVELFEWLGEWQSGNPPPNVWIGATVVNQQEADRDVPKLLSVPARVRFLSIEPMLGPISLRWLSAWPENAPTTAQRTDSNVTDHLDGLRRLDWIICGGESGPGARPMHQDWVRSLRDQCEAANVPFMVKQLSSGGSKAITNLSDFPPDLRIRRFPEISS